MGLGSAAPTPHAHPEVRRELKRKIGTLTAAVLQSERHLWQEFESGHKDEAPVKSDNRNQLDFGAGDEKLQSNTKSRVVFRLVEDHQFTKVGFGGKEMLFSRASRCFWSTRVDLTRVERRSTLTRQAIGPDLIRDEL